jgi:hypothetical protein
LIEFRYVVEFKKYVPNPTYYNITKSLNDLTIDELTSIAKIDAELADLTLLIQEDLDVGVEIWIDGKLVKTVGEKSV